MKSVFSYLAGIILLAGSTYGADEELLKSLKDKVSYTLGISTGKNLKQ
jgi:hypothetical protein